jgi:tetratricopeptide (TPR) repeat protein
MVRIWFLRRKLTIEKCHEFFHLGEDYLIEQRYKEALKIGKMLIKEPYSGGYELSGRALWGLGQHQKALKVLLAGSKKYPSVARLWEYIGEYFSNFGKYENAIKAFNRYHSCKNSFPDIYHYNVAIVYSRWEKYEQAIWHLSQLGEETQWMPAAVIAETWCSFLLDLEDIESAEEYFEKAKLLRSQTSEGDSSFLKELESKLLEVKSEAVI